MKKYGKEVIVIIRYEAFSVRSLIPSIFFAIFNNLKVGKVVIGTEVLWSIDHVTPFFI